MSKVFVIGATGGVARRLCPLLIQSGHQVTGLVRNPEKAAPLADSGTKLVVGDIVNMTKSDFTEAARGAEVIVFSAGAAGSGVDRTTAIDGDGAINAMSAATELGIRRFILVSAFPEAGRRGERREWFEHYMAEKKRADIALATSTLDWVILRPGTLTDDEGNGLVTLGPAIQSGPVARGNVAKTIKEIIGRPEIKKRILELTDGETPIAEALSTAN